MSNSNRDSAILPPSLDSPPPPPHPTLANLPPHDNSVTTTYPPSPGPHTPSFDTPLLQGQGSPGLGPGPGLGGGNGPLSPPTPNFSRPHPMSRGSFESSGGGGGGGPGSYSDSPRNSDFLPPHAHDPSQPRFIGPAAGGMGNPAIHGFNRESYASMGGSESYMGSGSRGQTPVYPYPHSGMESAANSSYALNEGHASGLPSGAAAPMGGYRDDPNSGGAGEKEATGYGGGMTRSGGSGSVGGKRKSGRKTMWLVVLGAVILAVIGAVVAVYFTVIRPKSSSSSSSSDSNSNGSGGGKGDHDGDSGHVLATSGGDGSTVTMEDGSTFVYNNTFGGKWYWDPKDPLNNEAQAQGDVAPLKEEWRWGVDRIRGVNLGGWLNTEPFIVPALYEKYTPTPVDEWTLSQAMAADTAGGGLNQLEEHYKTFITEKDFAEIAGAGLNWVRIPIGWWAIEVREGEPFLPKVSWTYFLKAIQWARKYGIRINLDLHAVPGSQNGWNHSGRLGEVNFLRGPMGFANAQRALDYVRILAEFVSQPEYRDVVAMFGVLNEPKNDQTGAEQMLAFYYEAYKIIRSITGEGTNTGPMISYHDAFLPRSSFVDWLPNADRISLDNHPYLCFGGQSSSPYSSYSTTPCTTWSANFQSIMKNFGLIVAGEWSNAVTDCGLFVNGVGLGTRYEGDYEFGSWPRMGSCDEWTEYEKWDGKTKADIKKFAMASMDALGNAFFWTWRIGESLSTGKVESPQWSYKLGLQEGWMPTDPRSADGTCSSQGGSPADVALQPWQTGGTGAGQIPQANKDAMVWPPSSIMNAGPPAGLQTYTPTGTLVKLPSPTFTGAASGVDLGDGWTSEGDTAGMAVMPEGCAYVDPWIGTAGVVTPCGGSGSGSGTTGGDAVRAGTTPAPVPVRR